MAELKKIMFDPTCLPSYEHCKAGGSDLLVQWRYTKLQNLV